MKPGASHAPLGSAVSRHVPWQFPAGQQTGNAPALYNHSVIVVARVAIKDGACHDSMPARSRHRVLVTFRKCRGWSTSIPSLRAKWRVMT